MVRKNAESRIANYLHQIGREKGFPVMGNFELTARCNFNCPMCYVHMTQEQVNAAGRELTASQWLDLAKKARDRGMIFALLTGGEPLMRKDFFEIYDGMKKLGLVISVNTNGSLLAGKILERFLEDPPFRFNISLYGGSNETYQNMCGIPVYDRVKENIRALRQAGVQVSLNLSITPYNKDDLEQIYQDAEELDVNVRASSYMYPPIRINGEEYGCGNRMPASDAAACSVRWDQIRFTPEEFAMRARNTAALVCRDEDSCPMEEEGEGVRCRAGSTAFWISWDGKMMPCGMMTRPVVYPIEEGFDAAWDCLRRETAALRLPAACSVCQYKKVCASCAAVCLTETGKFDGVPEYVCDMTKEQVRIFRQMSSERKE